MEVKQEIKKIENKMCLKRKKKTKINSKLN